MHQYYEEFSLALVNYDSITLSLNMDLAPKKSNEEGKSN